MGKKGIKINVDTTEKPPAVLSLCSGYGGLELGLERVFGEITILTHVEIEAFAIANLVNKMETGRMVPAPIWTDLKTFKAGLFRGLVDILTGGYPCQPFSAAGKRRGSEDPRHLWPFVRETIRACQPRWVFFENVEGHISKGLTEVLSDLEKMAYAPVTGVFSAAEVGAPHQRKRVFILAYSGGPGPRDDNGSTGCEAGSEILRQKDREERSVRSNSAGSDKELADTRLFRPEKSKKQTTRIEQSGKELGNTASFRLCGSCADTGEISANPQRKKCGLHESERTGSLSRYGSQSPWPARPGEPQYEWEEPRVVGDNNCKRLPKRHVPRKPGKKETTLQGRESSRTNDAQGVRKCQIEPQLGRTIDGNRDRVDRLRLCGNGVVPEQAEKAFITLMDRIINPNVNYAQPSIQMEMF